jgi:hypothetical protein
LYVPAGVGVAVNVTFPPQAVVLLTVTVGFGLIVTVPLTEVLEQPVVVFVMITL